MDERTTSDDKAVNAETNGKMTARAKILLDIRTRMRNPREDSPASGIAFSLPEFREPFPHLDCFMCEATESGTSRKGCTVTLWVDHQGLHAVLNDRDTRLKAFFVACSVNSLWADIDAFLASPEPKWVTAQGTPPSRRKN